MMSFCNGWRKGGPLGRANGIVSGRERKCVMKVKWQRRKRSKTGKKKKKKKKMMNLSDNNLWKKGQREIRFGKLIVQGD